MCVQCVINVERGKKEREMLCNSFIPLLFIVQVIIKYNFDSIYSLSTRLNSIVFID